MGECAFCPHTGKLSREHIFAKWVRDLLPGETEAFYVGGKANRNERFKRKAIDWKATVVCKKCNETWMSGIEDKIAKPAITPLVLGEINIPITQEIARSIAIYAFKTAVVQNHADQRRNPFFSTRLRHAFRAHRSIPDNVSIWICGMRQNLPSVQVVTIYYSEKQQRSLMYAFTCAIGHFVMQVVTIKQIGQTRFRPLAGFESIGIPVWPSILSGQTWPGSYVLNGDDGHFLGFAKRWEKVGIVSM